MICVFGNQDMGQQSRTGGRPRSIGREGSGATSEVSGLISTGKKTGSLLTVSSGTQRGSFSHLKIRFAFIA